MLLLDTFWGEVSTRLTNNGWSIVWGSRYDPTHVEGFTPTGRAFTLDIVTATADGQPHDTDTSTLTLTVAGRTRSITRTRAQLENGTASVDALIEARNLFPVNQR